MSGDPARTRFLAIQAVRWGGLVFVGLGLLVIYRKLPPPAVVGYALAAIGLPTALIVPTVLTRRWRTPRR